MLANMHPGTLSVSVLYVEGFVDFIQSLPGLGHGFNELIQCFTEILLAMGAVYHIVFQSTGPDFTRFAVGNRSAGAGQAAVAVDIVGLEPHLKLPGP
jgi:hypothetical protein